MEQRRDDEVQRLERNLNKMETTLNEHYCNIGKQLLEMVEQEDQEINNLVDKIIEIKKQLYELEQTVQCPSCLLMNSSDSRYCSHCGCEL
jgi:septal ring factor EnvC (AmiA/AmiB activator)